MTELKRENLLATEWDVRDWSEEQKRWWQEKSFKLGFSWPSGSTKVRHLGAEVFQLWDDMDMTYSGKFSRDKDFTEKQFSDMFPDHEAPKPINVVEEIKQLFLAEMDKEDFDGDEDERGFEGLVYVEPKDYTPNIAKHNLSEDQLNFIIGKFGGLEMTSKEEDTYIYIDDGVVKTTRYPLYTTKDKIVTFNDLFKYEDGL